MAQLPKTPPHDLFFPGARDGKCMVKTIDVWAHNLEKELGLIRRIVPDFPIVAVTTSPEVAGGYPAPDSSYDTFRAYMDNLHFAQVTLAFTNPGGDLALNRFWRFHMGDFDPGHLRYFVEMGVDVPARRVRNAQLGGALMTYETLLNPKVTWLTCDGGTDMAFLLKCIVPLAPHPPLRNTFLRLCRAFFPAMYDLKVISSKHREAPCSVVAAASHAFAGFLDEPISAARRRVERCRGMLFGFDYEPTAIYREPFTPRPSIDGYYL